MRRSENYGVGGTDFSQRNSTERLLHIVVDESVAIFGKTQILEIVGRAAAHALAHVIAVIRI
jgi:hypothetical protein